MDLCAEIEPDLTFRADGHTWAVARQFREIGNNGKPLFHKEFVPYHFKTGLRFGNVAFGSPDDCKKWLIHSLYTSPAMQRLSINWVTQGKEINE